MNQATPTRPHGLILGRVVGSVQRRIRRGEGSVKRLLGILVTVAAALVLASCVSAADRLEALRSDPMADYDLPNALLVRATETAGHIGPGVSSPAVIRRTFTVAEGAVLAELDVIADAARREGWTIEEGAFGGYSGDKTIDGLFSQIWITGIDSDNILWMALSTGDK